MKRLILIVSLAAILFSHPISVLASNIANAIYSGTIVVTNNSTSAASSVSANMTLSSADLISQGYAASNFSNVVIRNNAGSDVAFMPGYGSNPWMFWVPSISGSSVMNYIFYAGGPDMSSFKYYFPGTTGAMIGDSGTLEINGDGSISSTQYVETTAGSNKWIFRKPGAVEARVSNTVSGNLTLSVPYASQLLTDTDYQVYGALYTRLGERFNSLPIININSEVFHLRKFGSPVGTASVVVRKVSDDSSLGVMGQIDVSTLDVVYQTYTFSDAVFNPSVQDVRIQLEYSGGDAANYVNVQAKAGGSTYAGGELTRYNGAYADMAAEDLTTALMKEYSSIAGVSSGNHTVSFTNDLLPSSYFKVDSTNSTKSNYPIVDNSENWTFGSSATPYIQSVNITVSNVLKGSWQWQYATTFTDLSGNGNTMYPSFPTTGSNPNVWGTLTTFSPLNQANAPPYTVTNPQAFYSTNVSLTGAFSTGNVTGSGLPGSSLVDDAAHVAGIPNVFLWGLFGGLFMVAGGLMISATSRYWGAGNGELIARIIWGIFVIGVLIALGKFDMWMLWFYLILTIACALASRHNEVGAYFSELNFIGFLSMAEVGMITINRILEGSFINSTDASQFNNLMFTQQFTILNVFTLPIVNFDFFTKGLPNLLKWNYVMFGGNAQMIQYLLYCLTAIMGFIIFGLVIGTLSHYFTK